MLDFSQTTIARANGAFVGSFDDESPVKVSPTPLPVNELTEQLLLTKITKGFGKTEKWYTIDQKRERADNIINWITSLMDNHESDAGRSMEHLTQRLYEAIEEHNGIHQPGEFVAVSLREVQYFDAFCSAVLLTKVTSKEVHLNITANPVSLTESRIIPPKFQMAALLIDTTGGGEYKAAVIDTVTKRNSRSFWIEDFLCLVQDRDGYFHTEHWMNLISNFAAQTGAALGYNAVDKADLKRRSLEYFNESPEFDQVTFERLMFDNENGRNKFADYVAKYQIDFNVELPEDFEIVKAAVSANTNLLRSRIQLDQNFKIDIDGRRDLMEQGFDDEKGKKYIKLYYDFEN